MNTGIFAYDNYKALGLIYIKSIIQLATVAVKIVEGLLLR